MSAAPDWSDCPDPQTVFLRLWREVSTWRSHRRAANQAHTPEVQTKLQNSLMSAATATQAVAALQAEMAVLWPVFAISEANRLHQEDGLLLDAMLAIDAVFIRVHPRTVRLAPGISSADIPVWLSDAAENRTLTGAYANDVELRLIARGPLSRQARSVADTNAESLTHRFLALTAAPFATKLDDHQTIAIACTVIGQSAARGVPPSRPGKEVIGFAPLAETDSDLRYRERRDDTGQKFLDVVVTPGVDLAHRLSEVVARLGPLDLLVAPELTLDDEASARFAASLSGVSGAPRLSIAGSGPRGAADADGRRFNGASAYNALGAPLWSHDKVWPYGMGEHQVETCNLFGVEEGQLLMEDIQAGSSLTVADVDGFGRVLVLICQDFQIKPAVADIIRTYQPDWVVVPIMDRGVSSGRWMHKTAYDLSELSPARFVVVSSLALAERSKAADYPDTPVALLVGPATISREEREGGGADRAVAILGCSETAPQCGKIGWNDPAAGWKTTSLTTV